MAGPGVDDPRLRQALDLFARGEADQAAASLGAVVEADPTCDMAVFLLGSLLLNRNEPTMAYGLLKRAVTLNDQNALYWSELGKCLERIDQVEAATIAFNRAVALAPDDAALHVELGWAYVHDDKPAEALGAFENAVRIDPGNARAHFGIAAHYGAGGEAETACAHHRRALEADPDYAPSYYSLLEATNDSEETDRLIARAERLISSGKADKPGRARLQYAIARGRRRQGRHEDAFASYVAANNTMRELHTYDRGKTVRFVDAIISGFPPGVFDALEGAGSLCDQPVFIVGMPRCGSTLVEQILSSHRDVAAAGEFKKVPNMAAILRGTHGGDLRYPEDMARFAPESLTLLAGEYLDALVRQAARDAPRITDKMLANAFHLGLIAAMFPNASIIHCRRDPMDTCLSCYFQAFAEGERLAYTCDLADLGFFYGQYRRMMDHWREVLPGRMLEVDYEATVADQEAQSRRIIAHVGLEWDDACLAFYDQDRTVRTASHAQVRKPVYSSSVGAWRRYEHHLGPLKQALGLAGDGDSA